MSKYTTYLSVKFTDEQMKKIEYTIDEYRSKHAKRITKSEALRLLAFGNGKASKVEENVSPPSDETITKDVSEDSEHEHKQDGWKDMKLDF